VFFIRVCPRDIAEQLGLKLAEGRTQRLVQPAQILMIMRAVRQVYINGRWRLHRWIVVRLVQRDSKDFQLSVARAERFQLAATAALQIMTNSSSAWQRTSRFALWRKN